MDDLDRTLERALRDPEFKKQWDADAEERRISRMVMEARIAQNLSQCELAARSGVDQRVLSRIETGVNLPSIHTLAKIAHGLGRELSIGFV